MELSIQEVEDIATLARLSLTEEEKAQYAKELSGIFQYMRVLDEVDISGVEETCQVTGLEDVLREDTVEEVDDEIKQKLIAAFPDRLGNLLKVKAVFK